MACVIRANPVYSTMHPRFLNNPRLSKACIIGERFDRNADQADCSGSNDVRPPPLFLGFVVLVRSLFFRQVEQGISGLRTQLHSSKIGILTWQARCRVCFALFPLQTAFLFLLVS